MKGRIKSAVRGGMRPLGTALARLGIPADAVTVAGVLAAGLAAWGFYRGNRAAALAGLLASGLMDMLDGAVARAGGKGGTRFGAALDSTLDRYGEGLVFGAILARAAGGPPWLMALALLAGLGSFLVSYVRARSEGLGIPCEVGILERPERLVLLIALAAWGSGGLPWILGALALLTHITFIQRLVHIRLHSGEIPAAAPGQPLVRTGRRRP